MKQRMEIIVVTEIDNDNFDQLECEKNLKEAIKVACKDILDCPKKYTEVYIEYGEPV